MRDKESLLRHGVLKVPRRWPLLMLLALTEERNGYLRPGRRDGVRDTFPSLVNERMKWNCLGKKS